MIDIMNAFPDKSNKAVTQALSRLSQKGKIVSVYKGFQIIIPAENSIRKIAPPDQFINYHMEYIGKPYYVGLLGAAALHGGGPSTTSELME